MFAGRLTICIMNNHYSPFRGTFVVPIMLKIKKKTGFLMRPITKYQIAKVFTTFGSIR